jgi:ubiquinone/menaquinone biosynthesis C-methylase UbiE
MLEIDAKELGRQLAKPTGATGVMVSNQMNESNVGIYELTFGLLSIENGSNILEIGIGNGNHLKDYFKKNGSIQLYGLDISETMVKIAKEINGELTNDKLLQIVCEDSKSMTFKNDMFGSVVCINAIYFWENLYEQLRELWRVLKNGGKLYLGFRPKSKMENLEFVKEKFTLYEAADVKEQLILAGFNVLNVEQKEVERMSVDGKLVKTIDICIVSEKN